MMKMFRMNSFDRQKTLVNNVRLCIKWRKYVADKFQFDTKQFDFAK